MKQLITVISFLALGFTANAEQAKNDGLTIAKFNKNGNLIMGRMMLNESDKSQNDADHDAFTMPGCGSGNKTIEAILLRAPKNKHHGAKNLDAYIRRMTVVFGNGDALIFNINRRLVVNNTGDGYRVSLRGRRCVRSVSVIGEQYEWGSNHSNAQVNVIGIR